jgi:hypothetical protein
MEFVDRKASEFASRMAKGKVVRLKVDSTIRRLDLQIPLKERRFCELSRTTEFVDTLEFTEEDDNSGTRYDTFAMTLHAVPHGNARTARLQDAPLMTDDN